VGNPLFVNATARDYHLALGSPAINRGIAPGSSRAGYGLAPAYQVLLPLCGQARSTITTVDVGAYEFGGAGAVVGCGTKALR
jgi:hypothetical protein